VDRRRANRRESANHGSVSDQRHLRQDLALTVVEKEKERERKHTQLPMDNPTCCNTVNGMR
jgi:hypothetical protein